MAKDYIEVGLINSSLRNISMAKYKHHTCNSTEACLHPIHLAQALVHAFHHINQIMTSRIDENKSGSADFDPNPEPIIIAIRIEVHASYNTIEVRLINACIKKYSNTNTAHNHSTEACLHPII